MDVGEQQGGGSTVSDGDKAGHIFRNVARNLSRYFDGVASLEKKQGRKHERGETQPSVKMGPCPLPEAQSAWMKKLMHRTVEMLGEEFEEKLEAIDAEVRSVKAAQEDMVTKDEMADAVAKAIGAAREELTKEIRQMSAVSGVGPSSPASPAASTMSGRSGMHSSVDMDNRTAASM